MNILPKKRLIRERKGKSERERDRKGRRVREGTRGKMVGRVRAKKTNGAGREIKNKKRKGRG